MKKRLRGNKTASLKEKISPWALRMAPFLLLMLGLFCGVTQAQEKHSIDIQFQNSIKENPSTAGMMAAILDAQEKWEKEIDKSLESLEINLEAGEWKALKSSQKNWVAYRDSEMKSIELIYGKDAGSELKIKSSMQMMKLIKDRALMLEDYKTVAD